MKFSFENVAGRKEPERGPEPELTEEQKQERFNEEIEQEADRLSTSVNQLVAEIDALGGPDGFKELMESSDRADAVPYFLDSRYEKKRAQDFVSNPYDKKPHVVEEYKSSVKYGEDISNKLGTIESKWESKKKTSANWAKGMLVTAAIIEGYQNFVDGYGGTSFTEMVQNQSLPEYPIEYFLNAFSAGTFATGIGNFVSFVKNKVSESRAKISLDKHKLRMKMTGVGEKNQQ